MSDSSHTHGTHDTHDTQHSHSSAATSSAPAIFTTYWIFQVSPKFHRLATKQQEQARHEFLAVLDAREPSVKLRGVYSLVGLRHNADLMFWVLGPDLDAIRRLGVALRHSGLGQYLRPVETYVGMNTPARYDPDHMPAFLLGAPPKAYVSLYPFVKTAEWYLLPFEQRREIMAEHGQVGRRYAVPRAQVAALGATTSSEAAAEHATGAGGSGNGKTAKTVSKSAVATKTATESATQTATQPVVAEEGGGVLSSTVDAFGLGDYEFILANESDDPAELVRMMHSLRATEARRYTKLDVPIYLCRLRAPAEALAEL